MEIPTLNLGVVLLDQPLFKVDLEVPKLILEIAIAGLPTYSADTEQNSHSTEVVFLVRSDLISTMFTS